MRRGRAAPAAAPWGSAGALRPGRCGERGRGRGCAGRAVTPYRGADRKGGPRGDGGRGPAPGWPLPAIVCRGSCRARPGSGGAGVGPRDGAALCPARVAALGAPAVTQCRPLLPALGHESAHWLGRYPWFCAGTPGSVPRTGPKPYHGWVLQCSTMQPLMMRSETHDPGQFPWKCDSV